MLKTRYIIGIFTALIIVVGLGFVWMENQSVTGQAVKEFESPIRIGLVVWPGYGPLYVAQEKGFFGNTSVEFLRIDTAEVKSLMKTGSIDAIAFPSETIQLLADAGVEIKSVLNIDVSDGGDGIVAKESIKTIKDLKGKTIAFEPGSPSHFFLLYELENANLSSKDIIAVKTAVPDAGVAFLAGEVDAAVTWEPWLSESTKKNGHVLASTKGTAIINDLLTFRKEIVNARPDDVKAIVAGYFKGLNYTKEHSEEATAIMASHFDLPKNELEGMISGLKWFDYEDNLDYFGINGGNAEVNNIVNKAGEFWEQEGLIKRKANITEIIDPSILKGLY